MFKITIEGLSHHEPARGRTAEELQHHLVHVDGHRYVRVQEWIRGGAKSPVEGRESV